MSINTRVTISRISDVDEKITVGLRRLAAQLSSSEPPGIDHLRRVVADPNTFLLCAFDDSGEVIGTLTLVTFDILTGRRAWIEDVVVDEQMRGQGIAAQLVEVAFLAARDQGARTIDLTSRPAREQANRLYERMGFVRRETNVWRHTGRT